MEIRCSNVAGFDDATQTYKVCNQKIRLSEDRIGSEIKCPKCNQSIIVNAPESIVDERSIGDSGPLQSKPDVMSLNFDQGPNKSSGAYNSSKPRCPKCGGKFDTSGTCEKCNYVEPMKDAKRRQEVSAPLRSAGFQLWLSSIATEGVSVGSIGYAITAGLCFFCLIVMLWGILTTSLIGSLITALTGFLLILVVAIFFKTRQLARERNADLGILGPFWMLLLKFARMQKWQNYDANLKGRKIIDCRSNPVDDEGLARLEGLKNCHVLDLENSEITDNGLKALYGLTKLQCLVLINTNVSDEAVTTLHQHYPRLWIWK